ncbi:ergothioneine biosynthesis protein EgtB [Membranicola marinus]|uniref:Ergothioneine biosynthesis protein EgtB n=1 Tax=Membranihabitans marinus TaxID=1227546 RepID=A0A953HMN4_9BACT|nr:ergothioneine biosynthesis protein EgtB [Membranihabitans marinus]MBY5957904.1 ergothioneine biosynthesis protein EgtB [Membranihabitans marinus]
MSTNAREESLAYYQRVRNYTQALCEPLETEDFIPQPEPFVSPAKWHLGHTSWFFEQFILRRFSPAYKVYHEDFSFLFNSYYNQMGKRILRVNRGNMSRPAVAQVFDYRGYVDEAMTRLLESDLATAEVLELVTLGINHEQQHQELLITDMKYILGHQPLFPVYRDGYRLVDGTAQHSDWLSFEEGIAEIGYSGKGFSYDNESKRHKVYLSGYAIQNALVSNKEFMEFIEDGGYQNPVLWLDEGWTWVNDQKVQAPLYWHQVDGVWKYYTLSGLETVQPNEPVCHVSHYEAWAYAEWRGLRLPTEFEWEQAAEKINWGDRWEWTDSAYLPYPGFRKPEGAVGEYNGKFMVNQKVLRGASRATSPGHSRKTYRNFFQSKHQWQCTGIRLAKTL